MASKERFSISMDAALRARVKEHAEAMGLDVSSYVTAAVLRQIHEDIAVARRFADIDADIAATEALPAPTGREDAFDEAELAAARAGIAQALTPDARDSAA
ncbi:hypothetical protein SLAV_21585 [Streptomyces lavendulae subsp. lavendulae]|uniref:Uncharacterized protein n=1 Tax=Streptomyces lavendulae subsp. lavendulae TaxID=58340 RepID=A0A2K8PHB7_STRLA|nr:hypothetical protein [Streptomyces lavendulae]ATZ26134.1 hypothetical protein SLAV_21585 [Streptomyces lavendulae subsp. lavendulae]QUQ55963.1 hypothetical protein SLLC_19695 [Streptomyces lavendulae subsp. lavendulae]